MNRVDVASRVGLCAFQVGQLGGHQSYICRGVAPSGSTRDPRIRLRVISVCGKIASHDCRGKSLSTVKWFLNVRLALSAALRRLEWGGTYWKEMFSDFI